MRLHLYPLRQPGYIDRVDWSSLSPLEGQRLREFGICEGASIEALHRGGLLGRGPLACRVGRMTIAMRRSHAAAIHVRSGPDQVPQ
ncbi:FeoA family protein [Sphingobium algorifonticola]|uniref:Ferrous iron transport protein A n=1 Tax=Sphingobium algorifonticola TaxID=2008318 RepID=A0A437JEJ6_9SPHN|nr:FeoA family protein [Sphingobium algorifonticola]RVT44032.1 ferrous iron transport protein A [Sphingobium algorifonticola]